MYSNICKQIEREKKIKYFFVYTVHPFSISSAFPSLFLLSPAYFFLHHSRPQGQQCKHVFFSFLVGQPYGFWLIQLWERERAKKKHIQIDFFAKYLPRNGDDEKKNEYKLNDDCKSVNLPTRKTKRKKNTENRVQFQAIYKQILEFLFNKISFFVRFNWHLQFIRMWIQSRVNK